MTRIAFVADVHVDNHVQFGGERQAGINRRCRWILDALARAAWQARLDGCAAFVVLGDLFDTMKPLPQVIRATRDALEQFCGPVFLLCGNHDQESTAEGDNSLGPLETRNIAVVEKPALIDIEGVPLGLVPFQPGPASEWFPAQVPLSPRKPGVLGLHLGIIDPLTAKFLVGAHDAIHVDTLRDVCEAKGYHAALAGNWHNRRGWTPTPLTSASVQILQVGTLAPTGFDNLGPTDFGTLAYYDSEQAIPISVREIPGPRFVNQADVDKCMPGCSVVARVLASPEDVPMAAAWLKEAQEAGRVADGRVDTDNAQAIADQRTAASSAASASTLEEAVTNYVYGMGLDAGDTDEVLERTRRYLKEAG